MKNSIIFAILFIKDNWLNKIDMLIIPVKEGESIERALKKYKKKFDKTGAVKELRRRQFFIKPSVVERQQKIKAIYSEKMRREEEG